MKYYRVGTKTKTEEKTAYQGFNSDDARHTRWVEKSWADSDDVEVFAKVYELPDNLDKTDTNTITRALLNCTDCETLTREYDVLAYIRTQGMLDGSEQYKTYKENIIEEPFYAYSKEEAIELAKEYLIDSFNDYSDFDEYFIEDEAIKFLNNGKVLEIYEDFEATEIEN